MKTFAKYSFFVLLFAACQSSDKKMVQNAPMITQSYRDDMGREVGLPAKIERVVSLAPSITEMIYAIGGQDKLVARSQACDFPAETAQKEIVTTYPNVDLEALKAKNPEVVLLTDEIFGSELIPNIEKLGLKVYLQGFLHTQDIPRCMRNLGKILDCEKKANQVADSLENLEKNIVKLTENQAKYRTLMLVSDNPLIAIGGKGFLHEMIQKAGGKNIFENKKEAYPVVTIEEILDMQPEYLILPTKNDQLYAQIMTQYPMLQHTVANAQKQVFMLDPDFLFRPGPRTMEGLMQLTNTLHSTLTKEKLLNSK
ncbi:MAG: ABC transporter substrate-binding protein [Bacteroidia bacterium]